VSTQLRATFDQDLRQLQNDLLRMGGMLDRAIGQALQALANRDTDLARQVIANDAQINALRFQIEEACLGLIARQQPTAGDCAPSWPP